jgi:hypothetical protein
MAKDIKLYKGSSEIVINESNLEHFLSLGYKEQKQEQQSKSKKDKKWQHITEKKLLEM